MKQSKFLLIVLLSLFTQLSFSQNESVPESFIAYFLNADKYTLKGFDIGHYKSRPVLESWRDSIEHYNEFYSAVHESYPDDLYTAHQYLMLKMHSAIVLTALNDIDDSHTFLNQVLEEYEVIRNHFTDAPASNYKSDLSLFGLMAEIFIGINYLQSGEIDLGKFHFEKLAKKISELENNLTGNRVKLLYYGALDNIALLDMNCNSLFELSEKSKKTMLSVSMMSMGNMDTDRLKGIGDAQLFHAIECTCDSLGILGKEDEIKLFLQGHEEAYEKSLEHYRKLKKKNGKMAYSYMTSVINGIYAYYARMGKNTDEIKAIFQELSEESEGSREDVWIREIGRLINTVGNKDIEELDMVATKKGLIKEDPYDLVGKMLPALVLTKNLSILMGNYKKTDDITYLYQAEELISIFDQHHSRDEWLRKGIEQLALQMYEEKLNSVRIQVYDQLYRQTKKQTYIEKIVALSDRTKSNILSKRNEFLSRQSEDAKRNGNELFIYEKVLNDKIRYFQNQQYKTLGMYPEIQDSLILYTQQLSGLMQEIKEKYPESLQWRTFQQSLNLKELQSNISDDTAILDYHMMNGCYFLLVITKNNIHSIPMRNARFWIEPLEAIIQSTKEGGRKKYNKYAREIKDELLSKALGVLPDEIEHLVIIRDKILHYLPFEILPLEIKGKNHQYLIDEYAISYQFSLSNYLSSRKMSDGNEFSSNTDIIALVPEYGNNKSSENKLSCSDEPLTIAHDYTRKLKEIFPKTTILENADKEDFSTLSNQGDIIHFSAHGCVGDNINPLLYYIQLTSSDDISSESSQLSMTDIYASNLNADLVVLSACESGYGQMENGVGIYSLARAFHYAGCPNTIATTAVVDEQSTSEIIHYFYEYLSQENTLDVALQKAKIKYLDLNGREVEPYLWGNIILLGNSK